MKGRYIIFADDDEDDLELITGHFKEYDRNVNVLEFKDGQEVIRFLDDFAIKTSPPVLIVLDVNMPRMNGKETLIAIRQHPHFKNIPVIIYTTSYSREDQDFCQENNATWVHKPNHINDVKNIAKIIADFCNQSI
ncbi:MAG TPA: response regulator [Flavisolibacter sp.]|nr:response regulator [Flavisolibacter sp.]